MRLFEIMDIMREYFLLGVVGLAGLGLLFLIGYFLIYRTVLGGKKKPDTRLVVLLGIFIVYIVMILGITFLNRGSAFEGRTNLHLFSSYREAWNKFTLRGWQFIMFNILMFVPLGFILPLINRKFRKIQWTMGLAIIFTLFIEFFQLFTGLGIFEVDDIFNNILGALIGYGLVMVLITMWENPRLRQRKILIYLSPLLVTLIAFAAIFAYYDMKEFGNLEIAHYHYLDMDDAKVILSTDLSDDRPVVNIYEAPSVTKETGRKLVEEFFNSRNIDAKELDIDQYNDNAIYRISGEENHSIWIDYMDSSYTYTDFSAYGEDIHLMSVGEEELRKMLEDAGIYIPGIAEFNVIEDGRYEWTVDKYIHGDFLTDGTIVCSYYSDNTIKDLKNSMVTYSKIKEVTIKSEVEAYEGIIAGKFDVYLPEGNIETMEIIKVELDYFLDSKGYYQPIYAFDTIVNGFETRVLIPAIE